MKSLVLKSYAKVNLFLAVLGKRADNYHTIQTIFERVSLHDVIRFTLRRDDRITVTCDDAAVPADERNLCVRSALALQRGYARDAGVDIAISKMIPVGAGMGGGSSNAAAALTALNRLWNVRLPLKRLITIGRSLGADIPFFLHNTAFAAGSGRGDIIRPIGASGRRFCHVIAVPRIHVSTPYIYKAWDGFSGLTRPRADVKLISSIIREGRLPILAESLFNGLQEVTISLYPQVDRVRRALSKAGAFGVMMSGSGPSVFGFARSRGNAEAIARAVRMVGPRWRVFTARTV